MTLGPAQRLEKFVPAMRTKGRISAGMDADLTVFDPGNFATSTFPNIRDLSMLSTFNPDIARSGWWYV
jgi:dihydroorotase-like cyclic amidohydrolase